MGERKGANHFLLCISNILVYFLSAYFSISLIKGTFISEISVIYPIIHPPILYPITGSSHEIENYFFYNELDQLKCFQT